MAASFFQFRLKANATPTIAGKYFTFIQSQNKCLWEILVINFSNIGMHYSCSYAKYFGEGYWAFLWFSIIKLK
jgi:hypothetical protein